MRPLAEDKGLTLVVEAPDDLPELIGDSRRTRQLIYNLASNALKFTRHGTVTLRLIPLRTDEERIRVRFEVEDTGIGISAEAQARIFERHYQAGRQALRSQGTGLGLAIVDSLTRRMGGRVGLDSELGKGSTFWFELPLTIAGPEDPGEPSPGLGGHGGGQRPLNVLVAEDNAIIAKVLARQLRSLGHEPTVTYNGGEAVSAIMDGRFDVAILDARMPGMDGLTAASEIRKRLSSSQLPIVLLTAEAQIAREEWEGAGIDVCLVKPVSPDVLRPVLARLVSTS